MGGTADVFVATSGQLLAEDYRHAMDTAGPNLSYNLLVLSTAGEEGHMYPSCSLSPSPRQLL